MTNKLRFSIATIAFCTLVLELSLARVFDVILTAHMGYTIITTAVFALGLGGVYLYLVPISRKRAVGFLPWLFVLFSVSTLTLLPAINALPFELNLGATGGISSIGASDSLSGQIVAWCAMFGVIVVPFFLSGLIISIILTHFSEKVHSLYFFDLIGAGVGCLIVIPLIMPYGPGGIQFVVAGVSLIGAIVLFKSARLRLGLIILCAVLVVYPATIDGYLEYRGHADKRGIRTATELGFRDFVQWDPVSKVEVLRDRPGVLNFALEGGAQGSWMKQFDGDFSQYNQIIQNGSDDYYFGINSVAHYFRKGTSPKVLIIGAAVGSETLAAVLFGASHVDSIELVGAMVSAAKGRYAEYSGNIFNHSKVDYRVGEGRSYLRSTGQKYDIIQLFSNHSRNFSITPCNYVPGTRQT